MKYYATDHLKLRLVQRNIKEEYIDRCLRDYHTDYPHKHKEYCHYYICDISGRNLKILVDNKNKTVITAFWLDS